MNQTQRKTIHTKPGSTKRFALIFTAACGLVLSRRGFASSICLPLAIASLLSVQPSFAQSASISTGAQLQAGIEQEDFGHLPAAIDVYQKIAADASASRDVRAKALLRLAGCEEKLGRHAKQVYEQILHDYADQPAAAFARKRLAAIQQQEHPVQRGTMTVRKIDWSGLGDMGSSDTDGQRAIFSNPNGEVFFGDLAGRSRRLIYQFPSGDEPSCLPSRDFSMVALRFMTSTRHPSYIALIKIDGTSYRELVRDDAAGSILGGTSDWGIAWSWDGRYLLVYPTHPQIGVRHLTIVSVADGKRHVLASVEPGRRVNKAAFSPDGRFVAYELLTIPEELAPAREYLLPMKDGEPQGDPQMVYQSPSRDGEDPIFKGRRSVLRDWTSDGAFLALCDLHLGKPALFLLPVKEGKVNAPPEFVRYGDIQSGHSTMNGAFVYQDRSTKPVESEAFVGSFDADNHVRDWQRVEIRGGIGLGVNPWPSFSPDGRKIAYVAGDEDPAKRVLILQDLSTGQQRILFHSQTNNESCRFEFQHPAVLCASETFNDGRWSTDLNEISADSGVMERLETFPGPRYILRTSEDDRTFYLSSGVPFLGIPPISRWERDSHQETVIDLPLHSEGEGGQERPSMDGHWIVRILEHDLLARSLPEGEWKTLVSGILPGGHFEITPDCHWVLFHSFDSEGKHALFRVRVTGGEPERVGDFPTKEEWGGLFFSPDGHKVLTLTMQYNNYDIWALENFEPPAKK